MDRFQFLATYWETLNELKKADEQLAKDLAWKIIQYGLYWNNEESWNPILEAIFIQIKRMIDTWKEIIDKNRENWKKWWRPKNPNKTQTKPNWNPNQTKIENRKEKIENKKKKIENNNNHLGDDFDDALNEFVLMRKKIKKPLTEKWVELIKKKLNEMYPNDINLQIKCLYKSIENSWQWVFALSEQDIKWYSPPWKKKVAQVDPNKVLSLNEL